MDNGKSLASSKIPMQNLIISSKRRQRLKRSRTDQIISKRKLDLLKKHIGRLNKEKRLFKNEGGQKIILEETHSEFPGTSFDILKTLRNYVCLDSLIETDSKISSSLTDANTL